MFRRGFMAVAFILSAFTRAPVSAQQPADFLNPLAADGSLRRQGATTLEASVPAGGSQDAPSAANQYRLDHSGEGVPVDNPSLQQDSESLSGWFTALEADIVGPHIKDRLYAPVSIGAFTNTVHLPSAELDWTGAPRMEVGYRFPDAVGALALSYQSLVSEGTGLLNGFDILGGAGYLRSRLNVNLVDLDYISPVHELSPCWQLSWDGGARLASVFFDSRAVGNILEQRTSNNFFGGGPHLGLDVYRDLRVAGLGLFSRLDAAAQIGSIHQGFEETVLLASTAVVGGATSIRQTQVVPFVHYQAGLAWCPATCGHCLHFTGGYEFQGWLYLGQAGGSSAELTAQGFFLRMEWTF